jgi:hypothetical protein
MIGLALKNRRVTASLAKATKYAGLRIKGCKSAEPSKCMAKFILYAVLMSGPLFLCIFGKGLLRADLAHGSGCKRSITVTDRCANPTREILFGP